MEEQVTFQLMRNDAVEVSRHSREYRTGAENVSFAFVCLKLTAELQNRYVKRQGTLCVPTWHFDLHDDHTKHFCGRAE